MNTEEEYKKGFNAGYLLQKYKSDLLNKIVKSLSLTGDFFQGLFAGKEEVEREYKKEQLRHLNNIRDNRPYIERGLDLDDIK